MALRPNRAAQALAKIARPQLNQTEIADACGVSVAAVGHWLNFVSKPESRYRAVIERITDGAIPKEWWDEAIELTEGAA